MTSRPPGLLCSIVSACLLVAPGIGHASDLRDALTREGGEVLGGTPERFAALLKSEIVKWAQVVKASGAKVD